MFSVSRFDVTECNQNFMLSDSPLAIRFSDSTAMDEMTEPVNPIPEERFRFCNHSELLGLANTNTHLPDITGEICAIHILFSPWQYVYVTLSLFDSQSVAFRNKIERKEWFPEADKLEELKLRRIWAYQRRSESKGGSYVDNNDLHDSYKQSKLLTWTFQVDFRTPPMMKQPIQLMVLEELRITNYRVIVEGDLIMIVEVRSRRSKNFALEK
ncbi:unnamed protein product [Brassica napus]|uniref:DUF223 domain-containing protein n=2 Tax=Brassica TaxID=3705 RepID=A0A3P6EG08_BRAOL|nr:unnamed protein product [Brassica napus]VDD31402.1 unnamed protein product [Brassica oleracea]